MNPPFIKIYGKIRILIGYFSFDRKNFSIPQKSKNKLWTYKVRIRFLNRFVYLPNSKTIEKTEIKKLDFYDRNCFFCRKFNGNSLYLKGIFVIPYGFYHLVIRHNVEPPKYFYKWVLKKSILNLNLSKDEKKYLKNL